MVWIDADHQSLSAEYVVEDRLFFLKAGDDIAAFCLLYLCFAAEFRQLLMQFPYKFPVISIDSG